MPRHALRYLTALLVLAGCPTEPLKDMPSSDMSTDVSRDMAPKDMSSTQDMPGDMPGDVKDMPEDSDSDASKPQDMSDDADMFEDMSEDTSGDMPGDMPDDVASSDMSEDMDMPVDMMETRTPMVVGVGSWGLRSATSDGMTWHDFGNAPGGNDHTPDLLRGVGFGDGTFIAVGGNLNSMIMRSTDGQSWDEDLHPGGNQWLGGVAYSSGVWVAAGGVGQNMRSTDDGRTWTVNANYLSQAARAVTSGRGLVVAAGDNGMIAVSQDQGQTWTEHTQSGEGFTSIAYGAGVFVAVGSHWQNPGFNTYCVQSSDGTTWTNCALTSSRFDAVTAVDGGLVVSRAEGLSYTTDGTTWMNLPGGLPPRVVGSMGLWIGDGGGRRWYSSALTQGWMSSPYNRDFRAIVAGWIRAQP